MRCEGTQCGAGSYLKNDLHLLSLGRAQITVPPLVLYPKPSWTTDLPVDVLNLLVQPLVREAPLLNPKSLGASNTTL